jgi:hypothetical protein
MIWLLPLIIATGGLWLLWWNVTNTKASIPLITEAYRMRLSGTFLPEPEDQVIFNIAADVGIDARLLAAIRKAEMGGPGREFGILSVPAPTYYAQASIAATTIRNNVGRYEVMGDAAMVNGRYTDAFIAYLGSRYAPMGASNDPNGLNENWVRNVSAFYGQIDYV